MADTGKVIPVAIEDEVKTAYLNYAMSVIVARALPEDVGAMESVASYTPKSMLHPCTRTLPARSVVSNVTEVNSVLFPISIAGLSGCNR